MKARQAVATGPAANGGTRSKPVISMAASGSTGMAAFLLTD